MENNQVHAFQPLQDVHVAFIAALRRDLEVICQMVDIDHHPSPEDIAQAIEDYTRIIDRTQRELNRVNRIMEGVEMEIE